ncbi:hypothetical protein J4433_01750 [Candidatus Pacearchaeota archaeon]|nr:hypothetical protein [Candidatus Pacearchaeota archaeon]
MAKKEKGNLAENIKKGIAVIGIILTTYGSIIQDKTLIIVGGIISTIGALMLAILK